MFVNWETLAVSDTGDTNTGYITDSLTGTQSHPLPDSDLLKELSDKDTAIEDLEARVSRSVARAIC